MKLLFTTAITCLFLSGAKAQIKAVTESGEEVILYDDRTWAYMEEDSLDTVEIPLSEEVFVKPETSSFQVKSTKTSNGVYIDPKVWSFQKAVNNPDAEFEFHAKAKDLYAIWITEEIAIPLETLGEVAISNARSAATRLTIRNKEYRMVNGRKVLHIEMTGTLQGVDFTYFGYYYSDEHGSSQLLAYSSDTLMRKHKPTVEAFLNGFVGQEE